MIKNTPLKFLTTKKLSRFMAFMCMLVSQFTVAQQSASGLSDKQGDNWPIMVLEGPTHSPEARYVQDVLSQVYKSLGYRVVYQPMPLARSFVEANAGRIDGLRARVGNVEKDYPNLLRIPVSLLDFEMVMIADRRKCGACDLSWMKQIAVVRGFRAFESFRETLDYPLDVVYVTNSSQAYELLLEGKVTGAIMSNTNVPSDYYELSHHWIKNTLAILPDYHYVHKRHANIVDKLTERMQELSASGALSTLRSQYGVKNYPQAESGFNFGELNAVTTSWFEYSDTPQGTYYKILEKVFAAVASKINVNVVNWKRAKQDFYDGKADILLGAYAFEAGETGIRSDIHMDYELPVSAFGKDDESLEALLNGDRSGTACYLLGYELQETLPASLSAYEAPTIADCIRLFEADRVDMLLDYIIDLPESFVAQYPHRQVLDGFPLFMVFQDTKRGQLLKSRFEKRFRQLIMSGELKPLFPEGDFEAANFVPSGVINKE